MKHRYPIACLLALLPAAGQAASLYYTQVMHLQGQENARACFQQTIGAGTSEACEVNRLYEPGSAVANTFGNRYGKGFFDAFSSTEAGTLKTRARAVYSTPATTPGEQTVHGAVESIEATASAGFRDTWVVTGGEAGTAGKLQLQFAVDGENTVPLGSSGEPTGGVSARTSIRAFATEKSVAETTNPGNIQVVAGTTTVETFSGIAGQRTQHDETVTLELDIIYGEAINFAVFMISNTYLGLLDDRQKPTSASTYFDSTARLVGIDSILDDGTAVSTLGVSSASSETLYGSLVASRNAAASGGGGGSGSGAAVVPLPASALLLLAGLGGLAALRRRGAT